VIICITGWFDVYKDGYPTGKKEFVVSHGIDEATGRVVILQCIPPRELGAVFCDALQEYVLLEKGETMPTPDDCNDAEHRYKLQKYIDEAL
jgi:hypothetical protein